MKFENPPASENRENVLRKQEENLLGLKEKSDRVEEAVAELGTVDDGAQKTLNEIKDLRETIKSTKAQYEKIISKREVPIGEQGLLTDIDYAWIGAENVREEEVVRDYEGAVKRLAEIRDTLRDQVKERGTKKDEALSEMLKWVDTEDLKDHLSVTSAEGVGLRTMGGLKENARVYDMVVAKKEVAELVRKIVEKKETVLREYFIPKMFYDGQKNDPAISKQENDPIDSFINTDDLLLLQKYGDSYVYSDGVESLVNRLKEAAVKIFNEKSEELSSGLSPEQKDKIMGDARSKLQRFLEWISQKAHMTKDGFERENKEIDSKIFDDTKKEVALEIGLEIDDVLSSFRSGTRDNPKSKLFAGLWFGEDGYVALDFGVEEKESSDGNNPESRISKYLTRQVEDGRFFTDLSQEQATDNLRMLEKDLADLKTEKSFLSESLKESKGSFIATRLFTGSFKKEENLRARINAIKPKIDELENARNLLLNALRLAHELLPVIFDAKQKMGRGGSMIVRPNELYRLDEIKTKILKTIQELK